MGSNVEAFFPGDKGTLSAVAMGQGLRTPYVVLYGLCCRLGYPTNYCNLLWLAASTQLFTQKFALPFSLISWLALEQDEGCLGRESQ